MTAVGSNGHNPSPSFEDLFFFHKDREVSAMAKPVLDAWPETGVENEPDSSGTRKRTTHWEIQTEGEQYIESLEKRLKRIKVPTPANGGHSNGTNSDGDLLELSSSVHDGSGSEDGYGHSSIHDEEAPVIANETTCLLYDAHQQQKEHERTIKEAKRREQSSMEQTSVAHVRARSSSLRSSLGYSSRRSSMDSNAGRHTIQPILENATPQHTVSSRIQFSDSVRISGGIKTKRDRRRISASNVFAPPPPNAYGTFDDRSENAIASTSNLEQSPPPALLGNAGTPRGSFSRSSVSGRVSRAASFLSEDGTATGRSRASTPASIYAPLLLPSKTAPSPSRHFYLTFKRDNGQATYRELVRRQKIGKKNKKRGRTRRHRSYAADIADEEDGEDSDSESENHFGQGWFCGLDFWTCGLSRYTGRWRTNHSVVKSEETDVESSSADRVDDRSSSSSITSDDGEETPSANMRENKSEMEVLFGRRPWRYLKTSYWLYRARGLRYGNEGVFQEEEW